MSAPVLGIDLGTTNTVVSVADEAEVRVLPTLQGDLLLPSVVSFHPNGSVLVGSPARDRRLIDARNTVYSVKRLIGRPFASEEVRRAQERFAFELASSHTGGVLVSARGQTYSLSEISAFVLREVRTIAEQETGTPCTRAVVTVPANFNELQRSATKAAGRVAGLDVLRILNEPTAAALAYGYGRGSRERVAVFDLGGGTFDLTILELAGDVFEVIATAGDTYLGGDDIDSLIAEQMADAFLAHHHYDPRTDHQAYERLKTAAEWAKCQLSSESEVQVRIEELAYGAHGVSLDLTFGITRPTLESMAEPLLRGAFDVCEDAMRVAAMRPTQLDNVILVGGSTRMPLVQRMVAEYFGRRPLSRIDPDLVVAQGAAIQARAIATNRGRVAVVSSVPPRPSLKHTSMDFPAPLVDFDDEPTGVRASYKPPPPAVPPPLTMPKPTEERPGLPPIPSSPRAPVFEDASAVVSRGIASVGAPPAAPGPPPLAPVAPPAAPPLLLDVTPLSLGVETVNGFCDPIIPRNSAIPTEQTRIFSTATDDQVTVQVRVCQGESRRIEENQMLGAVSLEGLPPGPRGAAQIQVTFMLDADGTLAVRAVDKRTGQERSTRIKLIGGVDPGAVQSMRSRLESMYGK